MFFISNLYSHEALRDLIALLASLQDSKGNILVPGLNESVRELTPEEEAFVLGYEVHTTGGSVASSASPKLVETANVFHGIPLDAAVELLASDKLGDMQFNSNHVQLKWLCLFFSDEISCTAKNFL